MNPFNNNNGINGINNGNGFNNDMNNNTGIYNSIGIYPQPIQIYQCPPAQPLYQYNSTQPFNYPIFVTDPVLFNRLDNIGLNQNNMNEMNNANEMRELNYIYDMNNMNNMYYTDNMNNMYYINNMNNMNNLNEMNNQNEMNNLNNMNNMNNLNEMNNLSEMGNLIEMNNEMNNENSVIVLPNAINNQNEVNSTISNHSDGRDIITDVNNQQNDLNNCTVDNDHVIEFNTNHRTSIFNPIDNPTERASNRLQDERKERRQRNIRRFSSVRRNNDISKDEEIGINTINENVQNIENKREEEVSNPLPNNIQESLNTENLDTEESQMNKKKKKPAIFKKGDREFLKHYKLNTEEGTISGDFNYNGFNGSVKGVFSKLLGNENLYVKNIEYNTKLTSKKYMKPYLEVKREIEDKIEKTNDRFIEHKKNFLDKITLNEKGEIKIGKHLLSTIRKSQKPEDLEIMRKVNSFKNSYKNYNIKLENIIDGIIDKHERDFEIRFPEYKELLRNQYIHINNDHLIIHNNEDNEDNEENEENEENENIEEKVIKIITKEINKNVGEEWTEGYFTDTHYFEQPSEVFNKCLKIIKDYREANVGNIKNKLRFKLNNYFKGRGNNAFRPFRPNGITNERTDDNTVKRIVRTEEHIKGLLSDSSLNKLGVYKTIENYKGLKNIKVNNKVDNQIVIENNKLINQIIDEYLSHYKEDKEKRKERIEKMTIILKLLTQ